jgi:hypothetical protein
LVRIRKEISEHNDALHVLKAEWAHMNEPSRLQNLSQKYLQLKPIDSSQLVTFQDIARKGDKPYDQDALDSYLKSVEKEVTTEEEASPHVVEHHEVMHDEVRT